MGVAEIIAIKAGKKPPKKYISRFSEKRAKEQVKYRKLVKKIAEENDQCEIRSPQCTGKMGGMQHVKRRGKNLMNEKYLLRSCNPCNGYLETHVKWGKDRGFIVSKFKKDD